METTYQEKRSLVNLFGALAVPGVYFAIVFSNSPTIGFTTDELLYFWGRTMMIYIPIAIVARMLLLILFGISSAILTKEKVLDTDERDKMIELKTKNISQALFALGLVAAMATQALSYSASALFIAIIIGGILAEIVENVLQLVYYRRGF